jgi:hypothetical protein
MSNNHACRVSTSFDNIFIASVQRPSAPQLTVHKQQENVFRKTRQNGHRNPTWGLGTTSSKPTAGEGDPLESDALPFQMTATLSDQPEFFAECWRLSETASLLHLFLEGSNGSGVPNVEKYYRGQQLQKEGT